MPNPFPLRYAILLHEGIPGPHYDLLFETSAGSDLATWRSPTWPITQPTPVTHLPDHRPLYLTYQGPLSHNRGHVTRIASGQCQLRREQSGPLLFTFADETSLAFTPATDTDAWTASPHGPA